MAYVFMRFSMLHELAASKLGIPYIIATLAVPSILFMVLSGGIQRTLKYRASRLWLALVFWMILAVPFSVWKGGSFAVVSGYARNSFILLFLTAGLIMTWKECRGMLYALAFGSAANVLTGQFVGKEQFGRLFLGLQGASIGNANDLAAHLLLGLTFVLYVFWTSGKNIFLRLGALYILGLGLYQIASTASRGALVAFLAAALFSLIRATVSVRLATLIAAPALVVVFTMVLPRETLIRYATIFDEKANLQDTGARDSTNARTSTYKDSLLFSLQNPLFGVGPGEFSDYEANDAKEAGRRATWAIPHNAYAQIASETGLPTVILLVWALVISFRMLMRTNQQAKKGHFRDIEMGSFFMMVGMVGFCTAAFFLPLAYRFYLPAISGLAITISAAAEREFKKRDPAVAPVLAR